MRHFTLLKLFIHVKKFLNYYRLNKVNENKCKSYMAQYNIFLIVSEIFQTLLLLSYNWNSKLGLGLV